MSKKNYAVTIAGGDRDCSSAVITSRLRLSLPKNNVAASCPPTCKVWKKVTSNPRLPSRSATD